ncbi:protein phosphatase 1, regulatory subunit 3Ca [Osmerus mordax]|uniref:protein phosphatase 1, regulatory subunit 3Ca n=1 Tax=Osmerus mordax TaxID=8014 RepID=UPI00350F2E4C
MSTTTWPTSVFQILSSSPIISHGPVMPVDMAMRIYMSHSPPVCSFLSSYEDLRSRNQTKHHHNHHNLHHYKTLRSCLSSHRLREPQSPCPGWKSLQAKGKKRVVFADSKGMSLTAIHVFSRFEEDAVTAGLAELQFDVAENTTMALKISSVRSLALEFKQPASDYLDFRNRLLKNYVSLESCSLQERSLTGTVKVRNLGFEKSVQVRVTFDSWKSYTDVDCTFMNNVYSCQDTDTFAFVFELPGYVAPQNWVEFCVCFKTQDQTHWDNNNGKNYRLKHIGWNGEDLQTLHPVDLKKTKDRKNGRKLVEIDENMNPRMSSRLCPEWQEWGRSENKAPYW